ncbi:MAG: hypothetical protein IJG94_11180 [Clostridia bacterium]|nr:hypothetical protein [Clostridia bacterium]
MTFDNDLAKADGNLAVLMYDYMPSLVGVRTGQDTSEESADVLKTANVFTNDTGLDAHLYSVSTKTAHPDATVTYSVYRLNAGFRNPGRTASFWSQRRLPISMPVSTARSWMAPS